MKGLEFTPLHKNLVSLPRCSLQCKASVILAYEGAVAGSAHTSAASDDLL